MVTEKHINQSIEILEEEPAFLHQCKNVISTQSAVIAYLSAEGFEILTEEEKDLLWYCIIVIIKSIELQNGEVNVIDIEDIEDLEDKNYELIGDKNLKFTEVADILFKEYEEEDLLAFAEDTLIPDAEDFPTPIGRKVIFISLKTIIDALT